MSLRPEDCAGVSGIDPTVVQAIINQSLTSVSQTLIKAVDERLEEFKSTLAPSEDSARPSKRLKIEASTLKKPGNQYKFQHGVKVLEKFESALESLGHNQVDKAKEALKEGIALVQQRIKLIRIADKSEFGWETVNQYEADELASDSEDDKRIYRSEKRAEKKLKDKKRKKPQSRPASQASVFQPIPAITSSRPTERANLGPCYACGKFGHLQFKCPQKAGFANFSIPKPHGQQWRIHRNTDGWAWFR